MADKKQIFILVAAAITLRLIVFFQLTGTPVFDLQIADAKTYYKMALAIKDSGIFTMLSTFTNPFYGYFVFIILFIGDIFSKNSFYSIFIYQSVLSSFIIYILYLAFKEYFGNSVTLISCGIIAVYSVLVFFDNSILSVSLINFFNILVLFFLFKYYDLKDSKYLLAAGLFAGLSVITRANFILFIIPVLVWLYFVNDKKLKNFFKPLLYFIAGIFVLISLVSIRNYYITSEFIPLSSNYGYNFYIGNNERSNGTYVKPPFIKSTYQFYEEKESIQEASRRLGYDVGIIQSSGYWFGEGMSFIFNEPGKYLSLLSKKVYLFFNRVEAANNLSNYTADEYSSLLKILPSNFGIISAFGLLGMFFLLVQKRNGKTALILIYILSYFISSLLFWVSSEYRAPVIMVLILLTVYAFNILFLKFKDKKFLELTVSLGFVILFGYWANTTNPLLERYSSPADDYIAYGLEYKSRNMTEEALDMLLKSINSDSTNKFLYFEIASLYAEKNDQVNSLKYYNNSPGIEKIPDSLKTGYLTFLANEKFSNKRFNEAKDILKRLIIYDSVNFKHINNLGNCYLELDSLNEAVICFERAVLLNAAYAPAYYNLGVCYSRKKDYSKAFRNFISAYNNNTDEPVFILRLIETGLALNDITNAKKYETEFRLKFGNNETLMAQLKKIIGK